ncbi:MAG: hypothetical protein PF444_02410, partial [Bacteroidales bacterium]|nr:hypothetical protein [Bacteroidales bacterium]
FPTNYQPHVIPGFWTVDGCKPKDTNAFPWEPMPDFSKSWFYGKGINDAKGYGLLQTDKGARLRFTPIDEEYGNMSLTLNVSPAKTAGQGFGSATGQYLDVCIKFNTKTLTGYGLRIERTPKDDHSVEFVLIKYQNGTVTRISDAISSTCYRTYCSITLEVRGNTLMAHATTNANIQTSKNTHILPKVNLEATISKNIFGGIYFQHTGSAGASATMFNWLKVQWEK